MDYSNFLTSELITAASKYQSKIAEYVAAIANGSLRGIDAKMASDRFFKFKKEVTAIVAELNYRNSIKYVEEIQEEINSRSKKKV